MATVYERCCFLQSTTGKSLSSFYRAKRLLKRMGFSQKRSVGALERDEFRGAAWKVMVSEEVDPQWLVFVAEMGREYLPLSPACGVAPRAAGTYCSVLATVARTPPCSPV